MHISKKKERERMNDKDSINDVNKTEFDVDVGSQEHLEHRKKIRRGVLGCIFGLCAFLAIVCCCLIAIVVVLYQKINTSNQEFQGKLINCIAFIYIMIFYIIIHVYFAYLHIHYIIKSSLTSHYNIARNSS